MHQLNKMHNCFVGSYVQYRPPLSLSQIILAAHIVEFVFLLPENQCEIIISTSLVCWHDFFTTPIYYRYAQFMAYLGTNGR